MHVPGSRAGISSGFAGVGVLLLVLASVSPSGWYPVVQLFAGLAFIAVSHVLTPCRDQITRWWNARVLGNKGAMIEPRGVLNTGHEGGKRTAVNDVWI